MKKSTNSPSTWKTLIIFPAVIFIFTAFSLKAVRPDAVVMERMMVDSRRLVFEGSKKTEEIKVTNTGKETTQYRVSLLNYKMDDDGRFEEVKSTDPVHNTAEKYVRFSPETLILEPGEEKSISVELVNTEGLKTGEYRSHIYLGEVPKNKVPSDATPGHSSIFGFSLPVIIRVGETNVRVSLTDLKLELENNVTPKLQLTFKRSGNMSVYGDLEIVYISPQGKITQMQNVKGIAVYTPNDIRRFTVSLDSKSEVDYHKGSLSLSYSSKDGNIKYAEAELQLR